jgi:hypothetical protein
MNTSIIVIIVMIVLFIILFIAFYYYYWLPYQSNVKKYQIPLITTETIFDEDYHNILQTSVLVTSRDTLLIPKLGYGISFAWDMYIPSQSGNDKWQTSFNRLKQIISMNDSPVISYHPKKNYLSIVLKYRNNPFYAQYAEIKFKDMKLQKYSHYILVIDNRNIKLYIDGVLISIKTLPSIPVIYDLNSEISLGEKNNNFLGKINNLTLYPYPLLYNEISSV